MVTLYNSPLFVFCLCGLCSVKEIIGKVRVLLGHICMINRQGVKCCYAAPLVLFRATSGFWQIPLTEESSLLTFITPLGQYDFNRLSFAVSSAPEHFQCSGVVCYADDILVCRDPKICLVF